MIRKSSLSRIKHRFGPFVTSEWKFKLSQVREQSKRNTNEKSRAAFFGKSRNQSQNHR